VNPELARFLDGMSLYGSLGPFLVLADWLQQQNDPWGELISLQCLRTNDPAASEHRIAQLIAELAPRLWPADDFLVKSYWRGFVSSIRVKDSEGPAWLGEQLARLLDADGIALCTEISFRNLELGDGNVPMLIGLRDRFHRMTRIDFDGNWFGTEAIARLRETYPHATFEHQGPDSTGGGLGKTW
jgi:hypothetical protein